MPQPPILRIGGMATMPTRAHTLPQALETILPQVDRLYLFLDKYEDVPATLPADPKLIPLLPSQYAPLAGDGKFLGLELLTESGLYFCFDDDIYYPPIYVKWLTLALRRHHFRALVGVHGMVFCPPHQSYLRDRRTLHFHAARSLDCHVDELGSGTLAFHTDSIRLHARTWQHHDMTDLMVAIEAVEQRIPRIAVRRPENFLRAIEENQSDSLWKDLQKDDHRQTAIMRAALAAFPLDWQDCAAIPQTACSRQSLGYSDSSPPPPEPRPHTFRAAYPPTPNPTSPSPRG